MHSLGVGSVLVAGQGTESRFNERDGMAASNEGCLEAGDEVVLEGNWRGMGAWNGGKVTGGIGVHCNHNREHGLACCCSRSSVEIGDKAKSCQNGKAGFCCDVRGRMIVGARAEAKRNGIGFQVLSQGSVLIGQGSVALDNKDVGYVGSSGGELVIIGAGGMAEGNGTEGVMAITAFYILLFHRTKIAPPKRLLPIGAARYRRHSDGRVHRSGQRHRRACGGGRGPAGRLSGPRGFEGERWQRGALRG